MKITKWQVTLTTICLVTGLLLTITLNTQNGDALGPGTQRSITLASMAEKLQNEITSLEEGRSELRKELSKYRESRSQDEGELGLLQRRLQVAQLESGLAPLTGQGITFTVDDRVDAYEQAVRNGDLTDPWNYLVHDSYLLELVNDLRRAGAEAITINGERIVTTSGIKCGGYIVFVNGHELSNPYTIEAIGNPTKLTEGIKTGYTFNTLDLYEYPYSLEVEENIEVPAYKSNFSTNYAQIYNEEESEIESDNEESEGGN